MSKKEDDGGVENRIKKGWGLSQKKKRLRGETKK